MDEQNRRNYPGEEHYYSPTDKIRPPRFWSSGRSFFLILTTVLLVVVIVLSIVIVHLLTIPPQISSQHQGSTVLTPTSESRQAGTTPTIAPPTAASSPSVTSGTVLCQADWSSGMNGWVGASEWKVLNGKLLSDGTNTGPGVSVAPTGSNSVMAPCQLSTTNYAVEATMQIVDTPNNCYLAIRGRVQADSSEYDGYFVGYDSYFGDAVIIPFSPSIGFTPIKNTVYSPGLTEHIYRAEFRDNQITLKIDNHVVLQTIDNKFINTGQVGLENGGCQISVSSFQVTALV